MNVAFCLYYCPVWPYERTLNLGSADLGSSHSFSGKRLTLSKSFLFLIHSFLIQPVDNNKMLFK